MRTFTKQKFEIVEVDGKQRVVVPKEVFEGAKPLWEDFVIGKFVNANAPHVGKIHMIVNKIWRLGDKSSLIDVFAINATTVKFRVRNEALRRRNLNRGMWNIMDIPMLTSKWSPFAEEAQPAMRSIPLWVTLNNVPPSMFTDKGLEFLASAVGNPIRLHPKIEACVSFEEAQIFVEADLTKELPKEYNLTAEEEGELDVVINYSYPWLPPRCSCCQKWGHVKETCLVTPTTVTNKVLDSPKSNSKVVAKTVHETTSLNQHVEGCDNILGEIDQDRHQTEVKIAEHNTSSTGKENHNWITPQKLGRSPAKKKEALKYGEVSILSNSYSVLNGKGETGEEQQEEEQDNPVTETEKMNQDPGQASVNIEGNAVEENEINGNPIKPPCGAKKETPARKYLPRHSKHAKKSLTNPYTQTTRDLPRDHSKRHNPKNI